MDPFTTPAEIATILQLAATAVPPGRGGRSSRSERRDAYLDFQKAAFAVASCVNYMSAMREAVPKARDGLGPAAIPMIEPVVGFLLERGLKQKPIPETLASVLRGVAGQAKGASGAAAISFTAYWAGHILLQHAVLREASFAREVLADFGGALARVRIVGRPGPRAAAENVVAVLFELAKAAPVIESERYMLDPRRLRGPKVTEEANGYFSDCMLALGDAQKDLTIAVRTDLDRKLLLINRNGRERSRRWQIWRPEPWPGGWPGPDGKQLVAEARQRRRPTSNPDSSRVFP